jgi:hypothetical protein
MSTLLRPLTLGELLDRAFQLYRSRFGIFVGIAAVAYLPAFVMQSVTLWTPKAITPGAGIAALAGIIVLSLLRYLAVAAAAAATIMVVSAAYLQQPISVRDAYRRVSGMFVRIFFIMFGMGIGVCIGLVLLIVPGIILGLMWALAIPVAVLEDTGLGDSLSRSRYLTAGHRGRVFAIFFLYFALLFAIELAIGGTAGAIFAMRGSAGTHLGASHLPVVFSVVIIIVSFAAACLVTPVLTISLSLMYYDERVRKEAFDIQLMMGALGAGPAAPGSAAATA